jgi:sec-independent protein translocase protein TatA
VFGIGLPELIIILIVALLVVGPSKLPDLAKSLGKALGEFRRMADEVKETIQEEMVKEEPRPRLPMRPRNPNRRRNQRSRSRKARPPMTRNGHDRRETTLRRPPQGAQG